MEGKDPCRVAVIGAGYFGSLHAANFAGLPQVQLVGVCDVEPERAQAVAAKHGTRSFGDFRELLGRVDAVSVAVPTTEHFAIAAACLEAGIHVLVEKPISATLDEADRLIALAEARGLVLQVGHLERFNPAVMAMGEVLTRPRFVECQRISPFRHRGTDINVVLDLMIHDIDLILTFVRSDVAALDSVGVPVLSTAEDIANARLRFADGCIANITASRVSLKTQRVMRIFQSDAYILLDLNECKLSVTRKIGEGGADGLPSLHQEHRSFERGGNLQRELADFVDAVTRKRPPMVSGRDGRRALEAALIISRQIQSWRTPPD